VGSLFFLQKEQNPVSLKKKFGLKNRWVVFSKKQIFLNPDPLCDFPLIERSGTSHVTINAVECAPHT